jgi:hypothetical protein
MTNIKAKDDLIQEIERKAFRHPFGEIEAPNLESFHPTDMVDENWGWAQLSTAEAAEFLEQEAYAAHIGQFIHKGSVLDKLRNELPKIKSLDWIDVKHGERTPVKVSAHHTSAELLTHHEKLATMHRAHEQRVNYFKAKVKNLVTEENARIARANAVGQAAQNTLNEAIRLEYTNKKLTLMESIKVERVQFEEQRQKEIQATSALRISVDPRFQGVVDEFLKSLEEEK